MDTHVWPANAGHERIVHAGEYPTALIDGLKVKAKAEGLWNLFIQMLRDDEAGIVRAGVMEPTRVIRSSLPFSVRAIPLEPIAVYRCHILR